MSTTLLLKTKRAIADTKPIILEALQDHINFSYARFLKFENECKEFEKKYKMDSEFFLNKFDSGELGDDLQWFDWYASICGKKLWEKISDTKQNIMERITDYFSFFLEAIKDNVWVRNEEISFREIGAEKRRRVERSNTL